MNNKASYGTPKDRIRQFLEYKRISQSRFERTCGFSHGYVANIRKAPSGYACSLIAHHYPELNTNWLITGEGEMQTAEASLLPVTENERTRYQEMIQVRNVRIMELETLVVELQKKIDEEEYVI